MGTFPQALTCVSIGSAAAPTPNVDENCDGIWDSASCNTYAWAWSTVYAGGTGGDSACLNSSPVANQACAAATFASIRYTDGPQTVPAAAGAPDQTTSYTTEGTACAWPTGAAIGAVKWTCGGTGCVYY